MRRLNIAELLLDLFRQAGLLFIKTVAPILGAVVLCGRSDGLKNVMINLGISYLQRDIIRDPLLFST